MTLRDKRQLELANAWIDSGRFGIIYACPRFGKIRTTINILKKMKKNCSILIAYPDNEIKKSWKKDFEEMSYKNTNITYTTHKSLSKQVDKAFDIVIIDEIHLLSEAQLKVCVELFFINNDILGLTGTLSNDTENLLSESLGIGVVARYSIEKAIEEGVIVDYKITVIKVNLDDKILQSYKRGTRTEYKQFKYLSSVINKMMYSGANTMFMRLARMRVIQNSVAKLHMTKRLLNKYKDDRILVFCGTIDSAESLGIPTHHSKSTNKEGFKEFAEGISEENHMAVVKIGNTGVTYKPLNKVIINYFDSNSQNLAQKINRCMAMEYDNPDKKANIYIISTVESVEAKWLKKALEFFDKSKIKTITR